MNKIAALIAVLLLTAPARAIELSLEENRAERGSVGYVDMQRLFSASPDAQRAKEGFEELVRQAEERVNLRKAELLKLRQQLDAARVERDALSISSAAETPPAVSAATAAAPAPAVAVSTPAALVPGPAASTTAAPAPVPAPPAPAPVPRKLSNVALPGMAPDTTPIAPPSTSTSPAAIAAAVAAIAVSTPTAPAAHAPVVSPAAPAASVVASTASIAAAANMFPGPPPAPVVAPAPAGPTLTQRLLELDGKIIRLQSDIAVKESELTRDHDEADHGLLDIESRKTDQILARLYRAITEVAHREGVSVVVDKTTILYGHPAVNLTDKVLKYLREAQQP
ncbi:MAG: OmpH family outer membrane protein [Elusimicrobiota bacterium]